MVEATAMVYKVMEEQHNMDSFVPKEPAILKDEMRLNEFALQLCPVIRQMTSSIRMKALKPPFF
jgi:hypothetical protein